VFRRLVKARPKSKASLAKAQRTQSKHKALHLGFKPNDLIFFATGACPRMVLSGAPLRENHFWFFFSTGVACHRSYPFLFSALTAVLATNALRPGFTGSPVTAEGNRW
jgi:hypothetical protein